MLVVAELDALRGWPEGLGPGHSALWPLKAVHWVGRAHVINCVQLCNTWETGRGLHITVGMGKLCTRA